MTFKEYLNQSAEVIRSVQDAILREAVADSYLINPALSPLLEQFATSCAGGKSLRGTLVKLGYDMYARTPMNDVDPAVAFELFQTAILCHDDIIDKSPSRRGVPSLHHALGNNHYGRSQAICLGDLGMFLSERLILGSSYEDSDKAKAAASFSETKYKTVLGEILDVFIADHRSRSTCVADIENVYELKTAHYTIIGPLKMGAILARCRTSEYRKIEKFGLNLGVSFQMLDDILGIFGDPNKTGKSTSDDIAEGKFTTLFIHALAKGSPEQIEILTEYYGRNDLEPHHEEIIRDIFRSTGALDQVRKDIDELTLAARQLVDHFDVSGESKSLLLGLCDYLINRSS